MNIFVTGSTGFIGSHLCEELVRQGHNVYGLTYSGNTKNVESIVNESNFHLIKGDICSLDNIKYASESIDIDIIFHMASQLPPGGTVQKFLSTNVQGTVNLLLMASEKNVENIIISSSMAVYGTPQYIPVDEEHPTNPYDFYGLSKLEGDLYAKIFAEEYKFHIIILRYSGVYGPRRKETFIKYLLDRFRESKPVEIYSGEVIKDYGFVEDVVRANIQAMEKVSTLEFEIFNVGGGISYTKTEIANKAKEVCGVNSPIELVKQRMPRDFDFVYDIGKAKEVLDYQPQPMEENIKKYWEWYKTR